MARNLVNCESVSVAFPQRIVLDSVSLGLSEGDRIGVVGRNGGGKSTLLRVLSGASPDSGRVVHTGGVSVGILEQVPQTEAGQSVRERLFGDAAEHTWAGDARIRDILAGLLGEPAPLDATLGSLSGGEARRVELARLLVRGCDVLLLDEPTNHLDLHGVRWLADHLNARRDLTVVVVTHDRWFLDAVTDRTWEVVRGQVEEYDGGYSAYVLAKAERARQDVAAQARRANLLRKELAWLRRGAPARTSKPKFRIDAANVLISAEPPPRDDVALLGAAMARLGKTAIDAEHLTCVAGERAVVEDLTWSIAPGARVGLLGVNGAGKTTLLRALLKESEPQAGRVKHGRTVRIAHLSQHLAEIDPSLRVLEAVREVAEYVDLGGRELSAGQVCETLGFEGSAQWTPVADLSGGERRRLQLMRLLMTGPNVLVLDEPTNDLDVETLASLEDLLDSFAGTVLVVSHDRYFLERVCTTFRAVWGDGGVTDLPGGVEQYLADLHLRSRAPHNHVPTTAGAVEAAGAEAAGVDMPALALSGGERHALTKRSASLERRIASEEKRIAALQNEMGERATDPDALLRLGRELRERESIRAALEVEWFEVAERLG